MNHRYFTEEHQLFRQSLRDFLDKEVMPYIDEWEEQRRTPKEIWKKMGEMGFLGLGYPETYGGMNLDFYYDVVFTEEISKCFSGGFAIHQMVVQYMSAPYILRHGSDRLKEKYLPGIISGELSSSIGITEPSAGSDAANIKTTALREGDFYIVNGSKTFITNAVYGDFIVTVVKTDPDKGPAGVSLLVIDRDSEGVSATKLKKLGWHSSDTAELSFDNVKVPAENLIGKEGQGFYYLMGGLQLERLIGAVGAMAGCESALEYALGYMAQREAFGRTLNKFQVLRHRIAQLAAEIEATKAFVLHCCRMHSDGQYAVKECSMAKLLASELSDKVMYQCLQFFGGYGYMEEFKIARMFRDSRIGTIGGGSSEIMREIIAKMVIDDVSYQSAHSPVPPRANVASPSNTVQKEAKVLSLEDVLPVFKKGAEAASPIGNTLIFDFGEEKVSIDGRGEKNQVSLNGLPEADCVIRISLPDFVKLYKGKLEPMGAFLSGKLQIDGDMSVAMKLQKLIQ